MENKDILSKVKLLLNMTMANGCTEAEAATAMEKAQALLLAHNLTMASIAADNPNNTPAGVGVIDRTELTGFSWRSMLAHILAKNTLCRVVVSAHSKQWHIFGTYDNVKATLEMYDWLTIQLESQALRDFNTYRKQGGLEHGRTWKAGFFEGAIISISERLKKPMADFANGAGHAIVIYNDKAVGEAVHKVFPRLSHTSRRSSSGYDGRGYGRAAGNNVSLTPQRKLNNGALALGAGR